MNRLCIQGTNKEGLSFPFTVYKVKTPHSPSSQLATLSSAVGDSSFATSKVVTAWEDSSQNTAITADGGKDAVLSQRAYAPPSLVCAVLEKYEEDFFKCVNAKIRLLKLIRKGVITEDIKVTIESVDDEDSKEILYRHLKCNANVDTLLRYCEVAIAAEGYPNMQALGWSMQEELQQGGKKTK